MSILARLVHWHICIICFLRRLNGYEWNRYQITPGCTIPRVAGGLCEPATVNQHPLAHHEVLGEALGVGHSQYKGPVGAPYSKNAIHQRSFTTRKAQLLNILKLKSLELS